MAGYREQLDHHVRLMCPGCGRVDRIKPSNLKGHGSDCATAEEWTQKYFEEQARLCPVCDKFYPTLAWVRTYFGRSI